MKTENDKFFEQIQGEKYINKMNRDLLQRAALYYTSYHCTDFDNFICLFVFLFLLIFD